MSNILIIDDDELVRLTVRQYLEDAGHAVSEAPDGRAGMDHLEREAVDVLITDIIMPQQEGIETIKLVRKSHPDLKIIAMSGGGRIDSIDYLKLADFFGADHVLRKPFEDTELLALL